MATATDSSLLPGAPHAPRSAFHGPSRLAWLRLWFYLGVPLLLGFLLGWWRVGRSAEWPLALAVVYWTGTALISTALQAAGTGTLALALRRLHSPLWLTLLLGQLVSGALLVMPALNGWRVLLREFVYPAMPVDLRWFGFDNVFQRMPTNALLWVGLNLLFFHGLRMPRFGYQPTTPSATRDGAAERGAVALESVVASGSAAVEIAATPAPAAATAARGSSPPPFMTRVRPDRRGELLALEADGHYLHVHTDKGRDLILYRLSDALAELGADAGARVHRSWWVARGALANERHRESVRLVNGLEIPVSRSYRLAARERGWIA